jgi:hypothetical protein
MKRLQSIMLVLFVLVVTATASYAQNYKKQHIGWVTNEGIIKDTAGVQIAHVDSNGNLVDMKSGKNIGKAAKNGNYVYHSEKSKEETLTVSAPMNGTCEVKDKSGKTVLLVHENYKQYGACAYHCLKMKKEHKGMKMK